MLPYDPAAIVMFTSPLNQTSNEEGVNQFKSFFDLVHSGQNQNRPPIPIFFVGQYPRTDTWTTRWPSDAQRNALVAEYAATNDAIHYIDTATRLLEFSPAPDQPPEDRLYAADRHHLSQDGYDVWGQVIYDALANVVTPNKTFTPNLTHPSIGGKILFDFGSRSGATQSPDMNGNHWNNWHPDTGSAILPGQSIGNLITTGGSQSGIDLIVTGQFSDSSVGLLNPDANLLSELAIETATGDNFSRPVGSIGLGLTNAGFALTGLDPALSYDFRFFASSSRTRQEQTTRYVLFGGGAPEDGLLTTNDATPMPNSDEILRFQAIRPNRFGEIFVDLQPLESRDAYIGIMEITVVPEPSTLALALSTLLVTTHRRRR